MNRLKSPLVSLCMPLVAAALAVGCGESGGGAASASAKAEPSAAASTKTANTAANSAKPATSAAAMATEKPAADAAPAGASGATIKFMPKQCEEARAFVNLGKLLSGGVGDSLDALQTQMLAGMAGKPDVENAKKAEEVAKEAGLTTAAVKEIAFCGNKGKSGLAAISVDTSKLKGKLDEVLQKVIETANGKPLEKKEEDGWTLLTGDKDLFLAVKDDIVLAAPNADELKAGTKGGGDGASEYGDAASSIIWLKADDHGKQVVASVQEQASDLAVKVTMPPPKEMADDFKKDSAGAAKKFQDEAQKQGEALTGKAPFDVAAPAVKNLKVAADGENITITTNFPKQVLSDLVGAIAKDPKGVLGGLMH